MFSLLMLGGIEARFFMKLVSLAWIISLLMIPTKASKSNFFYAYGSRPTLTIEELTRLT